MSFVGEFGAFALKGNVIDLAVGAIIDSTFGKIVDAAVGDLIMPVVGLALGGIDFSSYYLPQMSRLIASRSHTPAHPTPEGTLLPREIRDPLTRTP